MVEWRKVYRAYVRGLARAARETYDAGEQRFFDFADEIEEAGFPLYERFIKPLEQRGVPSFPFTAAIFAVLLILLLNWLSLFAAPGVSSVNFIVLTTGEQPIDNALVQIGNPSTRNVVSYAYTAGGKASVSRTSQRDFDYVVYKPGFERKKGTIGFRDDAVKIMLECLTGSCTAKGPSIFFSTRTVCADGTASGQCIASRRPFRCGGDGLPVADASCGCDAGYKFFQNSCVPANTGACSDGTAFTACSPTKPYMCFLSKAGYILSANPSKCGCPAGFSLANGACKPDASLTACADGTPAGKCSATQPLFCLKLSQDNPPTLVEKASTCGCPAGLKIAPPSPNKDVCTPVLNSCSDGTQSGSCSADKMFFCSVDGVLSYSPSSCSCTPTLSLISWQSSPIWQTVTVTTDKGTLNVRLPPFSPANPGSLPVIFYVASDGSAYWGDSTHNGAGTRLSFIQAAVAANAVDPTKPVLSTPYFLTRVVSMSSTRGDVSADLTEGEVFADWGVTATSGTVEVPGNHFGYLDRFNKFSLLGCTDLLSCTPLGASQCAGPPVTHAECDSSTKQCRQVPGSGINKCRADSDCSLPPTHSICQNQQCIVVSGSGETQCPNNCVGKHAACNFLTQQCVVVDGVGPDTCQIDSQCGAGGSTTTTTVGGSTTTTVGGSTTTTGGGTTTTVGGGTTTTVGGSTTSTSGGSTSTTAGGSTTTTGGGTTTTSGGTTTTTTGGTTTTVGGSTTTTSGGTTTTGGGTTTTVGGTTTTVGGTTTTGGSTTTTTIQSCASSSCHSECDLSSQMCVPLPGAGTSTCNANPQCVSHGICSNNACVVVSGSGTSQCTSSEDCRNKHAECDPLNNQCILADGAGTATCQVDSQCAGINGLVAYYPFN